MENKNRMIVPIMGIERNDFFELFVQPSKYNIIPFDERFHKPMMFTPAYQNKPNEQFINKISRDKEDQ